MRWTTNRDVGKAQMSDGSASVAPKEAHVTSTAPRACPRCAAELVIPVVWGKPSPDDFDRAEKGEFALGGCCVPGDLGKATYWACGVCGYHFPVAPLENSSPIGRLLEEISWEGNARTYRDGGRGRENVLTTEVFALLDVLPRTVFLGAVLGAAHGADVARTAGIADVEQMNLEILPGDARAVLGDGSISTWAVQPDVRLESPRSTVWVEAKRIRASSFQEHQITRTLHAMLTSTAHDTRLLLLVLGSPPPVKVQGVGTVGISEAVAHSTSPMEAREREVLVAAGRDSVAWITWDELAAAVRRAADLYACGDSSTVAAVRRSSDAIARAIAWHS